MFFGLSNGEVFVTIAVMAVMIGRTPTAPLRVSSVDSVAKSA